MRIKKAINLLSYSELIFDWLIVLNIFFEITYIDQLTIWNGLFILFQFFLYIYICYLFSKARKILGYVDSRYNFYKKEYEDRVNFLKSRIRADRNEI